MPIAERHRHDHRSKDRREPRPLVCRPVFVGTIGATDEKQVVFVIPRTEEAQLKKESPVDCQDAPQLTRRWPRWRWRGKKNNGRWRH